MLNVPLRGSRIRGWRDERSVEMKKRNSAQLLANDRLLPGIALVVAMILGAGAMRLVPHVSNFTPVAAIALFGGARFRGVWIALAVPLLAMFVSDVALELLYGWGLHALMPVVYGCFALTVLMGRGLRGRSRPVPILAAGIGAAVVFFVVTNFAVWASGTLYPRNVSGLVECYVAAVPFFRNSLLGTLVYSAGLFGGFALLERRVGVGGQPTASSRASR